MPDFLNVTTPQVFRKDSLRAVVDPRRLEFGVPTRGDPLVLQLLKDNLGVRPVCVARTSRDYVQALGLEPYAIVQGLAHESLRRPSLPVPTSCPRRAWDTSTPNARVHSGNRTARQRPSSGAATGSTVPSVGIPALYVSTGTMLADVLEHLGEVAEAGAVRRSAGSIADASGLRR